MWLKLTIYGEDGVEFYVNVYLIKMMGRRGDRIRLIFVDGGEKEVAESPHDIMKLMVVQAGGALTLGPSFSTQTRSRFPCAAALGLRGKSVSFRARPALPPQL